MRKSIYLLLFLVISLGVLAQEERTPFSATDFTDLTGYVSSCENNLSIQGKFLWKNDLMYLYRDMYGFYDQSFYIPSGTFLTNIFDDGWAQDAVGDSDEHRDHLAISSVPLANGSLFLAIISIFYLSIVFIKKQFVKMKKIKAGLFVALLLAFCSGNSYAQLPLKAVPDNAFVVPGTSSVNLNILRNDQLGSCTESSILIELYNNAGTMQSTVTTSVGATATVNGDNTIAYTPVSGFVGQDSLRYKIICSGKSSPDSALVLINITDKPENIMDDACAINPIPLKWGIKRLAQSTESIGVYFNPLIGDIDEDGQSEMIVPKTGTTNGYTNQFLIFAYDESHTPKLYVKYTLTVPNMKVLFNTMVIAKIDGESYPSIFLTTNLASVSGADAFQLIKYTFNGTAFTEQWRATYGNNNAYCAPNPLVADFMGSGRAQVAVYDKIFDARTGTLLVDGGWLGTTGYNVGVYPHQSENAAQARSAMTIADIDNDNKLEIIGGNCVYKVNISDPDNLNTGNTYTRSLIADASVGNGITALVDIDNDGFLEAVTTWHDTTATSGAMAVYNPRTGALMSSVISGLPIQFSGTGPSTPFIGDITSNGRPEIVFLNQNQIRTYSYDPSQTINSRLSQLWVLAVTDPSAATTLSLFDFNQDNTMELVYRDEQNMRIINGSLKSHITGNDTIVYNLAIFSNVYNNTVGEYPAVADINNDGQAEIITTGNPTPSGSTIFNGRLQIFNSSDPINSPWAPARKVWDKYEYNPVYINDDLTVPAHPMNPASLFVDNDGNIHRPYNNFLQQATLFNNEGKQLSLGPDLSFDKTQGDSDGSGGYTGIHYTQNGDDYEVTIWVQNEGDAVFPTNSITPLVISVYSWDTNNNVFTRKFTGDFVSADSIQIGQTRSFTFTIPDIASELNGGLPEDLLQIRLNEQDNLFPIDITQSECVYWNNFFPSGMYGAPDQVACEGEETRINIYPQESTYSYIWFDGNKNALNGGIPSDYIDIIKGSAEIDSFFVDIYDNANPTTPIEEKYRINVYLAPDSLIWTGAGNSADWNDYTNWFDPNDPTPVYPKSKVPRPCTNVLIPDGLDDYPNLSEGNTTRAIYRDASCNNIHFEFGGEVARTDSLHYAKAYIQYNFGYFDNAGTAVENPGFETGNPTSVMERDRWYALSAPLNKIVTGDFSLGGKPHTWQMGFVRSDVSGTFTGDWNWPDDAQTRNNATELNSDLAYAMALLVAGDNAGYNGEDRTKGYQDGLNELEGIITLPYFDNAEEALDYDGKPHRVHKYDGTKSWFKYYWYYDHNLSLSDLPEGSIQREEEGYRFIFDNQIVQMPDGKNAFKVTVPTGKEIMLGNPFMSSLKFDHFYAANSAAMNNYFRLYDGSFNTYEYQVGSATLSDTIAVLQAFFIETKTSASPTVDLFFPFETTSITRNTGKAHSDYFKSSASDKGIVYVTASYQDQKTSIALALDQEGNNVHQLFYEAGTTPQIYFTDENKQKNAIQYAGQTAEGERQTVLPLGIRSQFGNRITLNFEIDATVESLVLFDKRTGTRQDLLQNSSYGFLQSDHSDYTDRFELEIQSPTAIDFINNESSITVYQSDQILTVSSKENLQSVEVSDMQGRRILISNHIDNTFYQMQLTPPSGIYIMKIQLENGTTKIQKIKVK